MDTKFYESMLFHPPFFFNLNHIVFFYVAHFAKNTCIRHPKEKIDAMVGALKKEQAAEVILVVGMREE